MKPNILWQYNEAEDKMDKKEKMSCSFKYRYIGIKLFWVDDRVKHGKIRAKYCLNGILLADFFTKPL